MNTGTGTQKGGNGTGTTKPLLKVLPGPGLEPDWVNGFYQLLTLLLVAGWVSWFGALLLHATSLQNLVAAAIFLLSMLGWVYESKRRRSVVLYVLSLFLSGLPIAIALFS